MDGASYLLTMSEQLLNRYTWRRRIIFDRARNGTALRLCGWEVELILLGPGTTRYWAVSKPPYGPIVTVMERLPPPVR